MNKTTRMALSRVTHDAPFRELVMAISDGKPDAKEIKEATEKIAASTSDDAALGVIAEMRQEWVPIGPEPRKTIRNRKAQQARMHVGGLLALAPQDVIDEAKASADAIRWRALADMAEQVLLLLSAESQDSAA
jgi:hypothetical protein